MSLLHLQIRWCWCGVCVAGVREPLLLQGGDDEAVCHAPEDGGGGLQRLFCDLFIKRFVNRGSDGGSMNLGTDSVARRGGVSGDGFRVCVSSLLESHQGRSSTSPGRFLTAAPFSSPFKMVERRPLPPPSSVTVFSGRRFKDLINLQAAMPQRRPFCFDVVCDTSKTYLLFRTLLLLFYL